MPSVCEHWALHVIYAIRYNFQWIQSNGKNNHKTSRSRERERQRDREIFERIRINNEACNANIVCQAATHRSEFWKLTLLLKWAFSITSMQIIIIISLQKTTHGTAQLYHFKYFIALPMTYLRFKFNAILYRFAVAKMLNYAKIWVLCIKFMSFTFYVFSFRLFLRFFLSCARLQRRKKYFDRSKKIFLPKRRSFSR